MFMNDFDDDDREKDEKSFKFLISGNFHLGRNFKEFSDTVRKKIISAQEKVFDEFIQIASVGDYTGVIICGDLFDSFEGSNLYAKKVFEDFRKIIITGASMLVTTGNHDPQEEGDFWTTTVTPLSFSFYKIRAYTKLTIPRGNVLVGGVAFDPQNTEKRISEIVQIPTTDLSILIVHAGIRGRKNHEETPAYQMTESEIENLPHTLTVLGHGHKFEKIGQSAVFAGSPQGVSFDSDDLGERYFVEAVLNDDKTLKIKPILVKSSLQLNAKNIDVSGKNIEQIGNEIDANSSENSISKFVLSGNADKETFLSIVSLNKKIKNGIADFLSVVPKSSNFESFEDKFYNILSAEISACQNPDEKQTLVLALSKGIETIKRSKS
ncbi:MAG: hypothetical protein Fur0024_1930 [Patescibacteria group bacterium]